MTYSSRAAYNIFSDLFLFFCRGRRLSIAGSWFWRKDIHRFSWISGDHHTRKEVDHVLVSRGKCVRQCRVYRSFEVDSDHFPVVAQLRIKLSRIRQHKVQSFRPNLRRLNDMEIRKQFSQVITEALSPDSSPDSTPSHQSVAVSYTHLTLPTNREV